MYRILLAILLVLGVNQAMADWTLDSTVSRLNFISIKNQNIAENHNFRQLSGVLAANGQLVVTIPLAQVETNIDIRNQRVKQWLFNVEKFAEAVIEAQVDLSKVDLKKPGFYTLKQQELTLVLHGEQHNLTSTILVTVLGDGRVQATSLQDILLNANQFGFKAGIDKLRQVAGLQSISSAVPVSFTLVFNPKPAE